MPRYAIGNHRPTLEKVGVCLAPCADVPDALRLGRALCEGVA